jgi:hypothetical protein
MKRIKFFAASIFIAGTRLYDVLSTFQFTPDLDMEANPLVKHVGLRWHGLIIVLSVFTIYTIYALYISMFRPAQLLPEAKGLKFREFIPYWYFGHAEKWTSIFWKFPKSFRRINTIYGPLLAGALIWAGAITTSMWLLISNTTWYFPKYHSVKFIYTLLIAGVLLIYYLQLKTSYDEHKSQARPDKMPSA